MIPVTISVVDGGGWLVRVDMPILNFIWKMQGPRMVKSRPKEEPGVRAYVSDRPITVIRTTWF